MLSFVFLQLCESCHRSDVPLNRSSTDLLIVAASQVEFLSSLQPTVTLTVSSAPFGFS